MEVERIFNKVPMFKDLKLDIVLFESKYPVLFTCINENEVYLFSCCLVNAKVAKWIGTKTDYETLIKLLQNTITIREAFLSVSDEKIIIEYDGLNVQYNIVDKMCVPTELLPTAGEYMDAEENEYEDEIADFKTRSRNVEFKIKPCISRLYIVTYCDKQVAVSDDFFKVDFGFENKIMSDFKIVTKCDTAYV